MTNKMENLIEIVKEITIVAMAIGYLVFMIVKLDQAKTMINDGFKAPQAYTTTK